MTMSKADPEAPSDPEEGAAGKTLATEKPFFVNSFRERVVYAFYSVQILGLSIVIVVLLIMQYNEQRDKCQCGP